MLYSRAEALQCLDPEDWNLGGKALHTAWEATLSHGQGLTAELHLL